MTNPFKYDMVPYTRGVGIELSLSSTKLYPHFIKWNEEALSLLKNRSLDFVYLFYTEQYKKWNYTYIKKLFDLIKINGYMNIIIPNTHASGKHLMKRCLGWNLLELQSNNDLSYCSFQKTSNKENCYKLVQPIEKTCAILRYGGIGDMMMASCVFPELKKQGYHITLYTHVNSYEAVKHDPHIDKFVLQDSGQVPAEDFREFCFHTAKKYDKFINLSESIEGTLLSLPDRVSYYWPKDIRHKQMNKNYYQITADICEVPKSLNGKFYYTKKEKDKALKYIKKQSKPIILWVLSGSSVHKFWPWQDNCIAKLLIKFPTATIILVGDDTSKLLQQGWENESRVLCTCGKLSVREVMTLCNYVDVIVTPETGVALSVQFKDIPKILLHSHSSTDNYAIDWKNCISVTPDNCECYPCHQMHYGFEHCSVIELYNNLNTDHAKVSECQYKISHEKVFDYINKILKES